MSTTRTLITRSLIAGALIFGVASCGGDDATEVSDVIEAVTDGNDDTSDLPDVDMEYNISGNDCFDSAAAFGVALGSFSNALTGAEFDKDAYEKNMETARKAVSESVRADFDLIAEAYGALADALVDVAAAGGMQTAEGMAIFNEAGAAFESDEINAAADRLSEYYEQECAEFYGIE